MASIYEIVINGGTFTGAAPADGFIDDTSPYSYMNTANDPPNNVANALAKMRANRRYRDIITEVHQMCNAYIVSVAKVGASADTAPSQITIRFEIEHGEDSLTTANENSPGTRLIGGLALKRCVARALLRNETRNIEVYDPTVVPGRQIDGAANAGEPRGPVIDIATIGALAANLSDAEAAITVTKIS